MSAKLAPFQPQQATYTLKEAMTYLRLGETTVRDLVKRGLLRTSKSVRKLIILGEDVETFITRTS